MSSFVPIGYVTTRTALDRVASVLHGEDDATLAPAAKKQSEERAEKRIGAILLARPSREPMMRGENSLRQMLHHGVVKAVYFETHSPDPIVIPASVWATRAVDGVLARGEYLPYGSPLSGSPYGVPVVTPLINENELEAALRSLTAPSRSRSAGVPPTLKDVTEYLVAHVDQSRTKAEWKSAAEEHFDRQLPEKNIWQPAWKQVPDDQKLRRGERPKRKSPFSQ